MSNEWLLFQSCCIDLLFLSILTSWVVTAEDCCVFVVYVGHEKVYS